LAPGWIRGFSQ